MAGCQPATREHVRRAAAQLDALPSVAGADVLEPDLDPSDKWAIDVTVATERAGGVPPLVLRTLADYNLEVLRADPQGLQHHQILAVA